MKINIDWDLDKYHWVAEEIEEWMKRNNAASGEIIMQSDKCQLSAPELLSTIVDEIIKPEVTHE